MIGLMTYDCVIIVISFVSEVKLFGKERYWPFAWVIVNLEFNNLEINIINFIQKLDIAIVNIVMRDVAKIQIILNFVGYNKNV